MEYGYDNYNTSYGAGGGANAGGFMGGDATSSPAGGKGGYGKDTLRPVTIKQLVDATQKHPDADFVISGQEISQVTFVGQVRNISSQATNHTYKLDDGTGIMEVKQWIDTDTLNSDVMDTGDAKSSSKIVEGAYCRVYGKLKSFNNKKHIGSHAIRPIVDYNEINFHLLEATYVHLFLTRGPPTENKGGFNGEANHAQATNSRPLPSMSALARKIYESLENAPGEEGLHIQNIATALRQSATEVQKACDELVNQSLIFTTIDDSTFAIMERDS